MLAVHRSFREILISERRLGKSVREIVAYWRLVSEIGDERIDFGISKVGYDVSSWGTFSKLRCNSLFNP